MTFGDDRGSDVLIVNGNGYNLTEYLARVADAIAANDIDAAHRVLDEAERRFPQTREVALMHARVADAERRWSDAASYWRAAGGGSDGPLEASLGLYKALTKQRLWDDADQALSNAVASQPENADLAERWAMVAARRRRWNDAVPRFQRLLLLRPDDVAVRRGLADALLKLRRFDEVAAVISHGGFSDSDDPLMNERAVRAAEGRGDYETAVALWRKIVNADPDAVEPQCRLVLSLARAGDTSAARSEAKRLTRRFRGNALAARTKARVLTLCGDWSAAGSAWEAVIQQSPDDMSALEEALVAARDLQDAAPEASAEATQHGFFRASASADAWNARLRADISRRNAEMIRPMPAMEVVHDALVMPHLPVRDPGTEPLHKVLAGGVFDAEGRWCPTSLQVGGHPTFRPGDAYGPVAGFAPIKGRWLFGGCVIRLHFGHFIIECLGRLWALGQLRDIEGIVFISPFVPEVTPDGGLEQRRGTNMGDTAESLSYVQDILKIVAGTTRIVILRHPALVRELIVPSQLLGHDYGLAAGHPVMNDFLRSRVGQAVADLPGPRPDKLYVTRARLPLRKGRYLMEEELEQVLAKQGYHIMVPESLPIAEQLRLYFHASHIILAGGSAAHLAALAMRPGKKVALLSRFPRQTATFFDQLKGMGADVEWLDAVNGTFAPADGSSEGGSSSRRTMVASLDFSKLFSELHSRGFVERAHEPAFDANLPDGMARLLAQLQADFGLPHVLLPRGAAGGGREEGLDEAVLPARRKARQPDRRGRRALKRTIANSSDQDGTAASG